MDRYFFHVEYGEYPNDLVGILLPGLSAARSEAVRMLGDLLRDDGDGFWEKPHISVTVADEWGLTLMTLNVSGQLAPAAAAKLKAVPQRTD